LNGKHSKSFAEPWPAKLDHPAALLSAYENRLVILDEIHRAPDLFLTLRGLIDQGRRRGQRQMVFYRTAGGAEIDLVLELPGGKRWALEVNRNRAAITSGTAANTLVYHPRRVLLIHNGRPFNPDWTVFDSKIDGTLPRGRL